MCTIHCTIIEKFIVSHSQNEFISSWLSHRSVDWNPSQDTCVLMSKILYYNCFSGYKRVPLGVEVDTLYEKALGA